MTAGQTGDPEHVSVHGQAHAHGGSLLGRVFSLDHKVIAKQFLTLGLFFLFVGGFLAMLIRWQLAFPGQAVPIVGKFLYPDSGGSLVPEGYTMLFTMHGTIMIFFAITPILIGCFGNFCIPLMIGAPDMAFPILNMISFWIAATSGLMIVVSFFVPGSAASAGWTAYPPLSTSVYTPGLGQTLWAASLFLLGVSSIMGAVNYITTVITLRAPGMTFFRMPLTIWGLFLTAVLNALFVPIIAAALLMLFMDRVAGTGFFLAAVKGSPTTGDPLLYQHLFWIFGHPEVYILILPAWGMVSDFLATFSRKPAFGYRATALSMTSIVVLSTVVYGHHMFVAGLSPLISRTFMTLTMLISLPSAIFFLNWLGTIWGGSIRLATPMLFSLGVVFVFALGGLTGLFLGAITTDIYLHDTYFVVGHFHYTMAASVLFGSLAAIYYWFPKMFGKQLNERMGEWHFWLSFVSLNFVFFPMLVLGLAGMPRRQFDPSSYQYLAHLFPINRLISVAAFVLGFSQLILVANIVRTMMYGEKATDNPWEATTLEWLAATPPPHGNFKETPMVLRGPHEHSLPQMLDRDWLGQWEPDPTPQAPAT